MGAGLPCGLFLYWLTLLRAESERPSPLLPSRLGVPALPTHRPISKRPLAVAAGVLAPLQFQGAYQASGASELVESEQPPACSA